MDPIRILGITPTNAEVQLIENPGEPSLFVAISRLRRCYPELPDTSWTGARKRKRARSRPADPPTQPVQRTGPVTRAVARMQAQAKEH